MPGVGLYVVYELVKVNRASSPYKRLRKKFLAEREQWGGWWRCEKCGCPTQHPELDHIDRTGMGGSPSLLIDTTNWQILCGANDNNCHGRKDSGFNYS